MNISVAKIPDMPVTLPLRYKWSDVAIEISKPPKKAITKSKYEAAPKSCYAIDVYILKDTKFFFNTNKLL